MPLAVLDFPKSSNWIPYLSNEELMARAQKIQPVVRFGQILYYIKPTDLVRSSFIWHPQVTEMALLLRAVTDITTYHEAGHRPNAHFKPSVAEVLAAIPSNLVDDVVAFEMVGPVQTVDEFKLHKAAFDDGVHVATTRLYRHA